MPLLERLHRERPDDLALVRELVDAHVRTGQTQPFLARAKREAAERPTAANHYKVALAEFARTASAGGSTRAAFEAAIARAPESAELHYRFGVALLESEQEKEALGPLQRAAQLEPQLTRIRLPLAKARLRNGDREGALNELRLWVEGSPTPSEVPTGRRLMEEIADPFAGFPQAARKSLETGIGWLQTNDVPQQAIVSFEEILRDFPDLAVVHALLGLAYQRLDDAGRAVEEMHRAIELDPKQGQPYLYLGELYLGRQRPQQAREALERAIERNPMLDAAYLRLGELALERQDAPAAKRYLGILASLRPEDSSVRARLSAAAELDGDLNGADRELRRALELEPENLEYSARLGLLNAERYRRATRPDEKRAAREDAMRFLQEVLRRQPENAIASRTLEALRD